MEDKLREMTAEQEKMDLDPGRKLRRIFFWMMNMLFALPLVKVCLSHF
jgi:hypothetical protein